ncbi:TadE family type IV pilus minor pilin [Agromyces soli]
MRSRSVEVRPAEARWAAAGRGAARSRCAPPGGDPGWGREDRASGGGPSGGGRAGRDRHDDRGFGRAHRDPRAGGERSSVPRSGGERGSATAELAVALPAVALVLAACLAAVMLVAQQVRLTDAAADAARSLGRGESSAEAEAIAARVAGGGVSLASVVDDAFVCATLRAPGAGLLGGVELSASSCAVSGGR